MLESTTIRDTYTGDDSTLDYDYNFKIVDEDHLLVVVTDTDSEEHELVLDTDYTVAGVGDESGGSITLIDANQVWVSAGGHLDTDMALSITRDLPYTQTTDIRNQGDYYPEVHETAFDKVVMMIQKLNDALARSMKASVADFTEDLVLPTAADRANKYLTFDDDGNPTATSSVDPGAVSISAFAETLLDDASAAAARATLGFSGAGGTADAGNIASDAVTTAKILALNVTTAKINDLAVTTGKINTDAVTTAKILDGNVTKAKISSSAKYLTTATCSTTHSIASTTEFLGATTSVSGYVITLPVAASFAGREITIKKMTSDFYQLTVADAAATLTKYLSTYLESITVVSDGTNWYIKSRYIPKIVTAWTPTGSWSSNVTYTGLWERHGDFIELQIKVATSGAPTSASLTVNIPTGLTITTAKLIDTTASVAGLPGAIVSIRDVSADNYIGLVRYNDTSSIGIFKDDGDATVSAVTQAAPMTWASGDFAVISVRLPISGAVAAWDA